jgi:hypothetical protein
LNVTLDEYGGATATDGRGFDSPQLHQLRHVHAELLLDLSEVHMAPDELIESFRIFL